MSLLRRLLSPSYREAVAAEASGDYAAAARAYGLAGLRLKVAEMHLLEAQRQEALDARWRSLRTAVPFIDGDGADAQALRRRLVAAYLQLLQRGVHTDWDRMLCREAAALALRAGDPESAGAAMELGGDDAGAADAFRDAGDLERQEAALARDERRRKGQHAEADHAAQATVAYALGQRDQALSELRFAVDAAAEGTAHKLRALLREREAQVLSDGHLRAKLTPRDGAPEPRLFVGAFPLRLGRDGGCQLVLRDAGISRVHAAIEALEGAPHFRLSDQGSRNGTTLNRVPIVGALPLRGEGVLGLGEHCEIGYRCEGAVLELVVQRGVERGLRVVASAQPIAVAGGELRFVHGRPMLTAEGGVGLNGRRTPGIVQLVRGDEVELPAGRLQVLP